MAHSSVATSKSENQVEGRLLLDVVIREGSAILKLLSSEDESLLIWGDALLVLDLGLDVVDRVPPEKTICKMVAKLSKLGKQWVGK